MFKRTLLLMIILEMVSVLAFIYYGLNLPLLLVIGLTVFLISLKRLEWGIYLLFGELFLGSRGRMIEYGFISLRMVIFSAVLLGWILNKIRSALADEIRNRKPDPSLNPSPLEGREGVGWSYWLLLLVIGLGAIHGLIAGNGLKNVFLDANGYLYLLILPAVISTVQNRKILENIFTILAAAVVVVAVKGLMLFVWFGYGLSGVATLYQWITLRSIGEITGVVGTAPRIFMQSQFYALVGLFIFGLGLPKKRWDLFILTAAIFSIILSLSRSFWFGAIAGAVFVAAAVLFYLRTDFKQIIRIGLIFLLIGVLEIGALYLIVNFSGGEFSQSVASRIENPAQGPAGGARLLLLPKLIESIKEAPIFGKGFGEEVVYSSFLPDKITPQNPTGEITSFAFEWGYLDTALKIGIVGALVYLLFIARIFSEGFKFQISNFKYQNLGILSGLVALVILNITTPYLNHPLGIGYLVLALIAFRDYGK